MLATTPCPCGSTRAYGACCGLYHPGLTAAPTPEALMRARYAAYVLGLHEFLLATWHPDTRAESLPPVEAGLRWLGLEIKRTASIDADHGTVEFVARSKFGGRAHRLHELSHFVREGGRWYYRDGDLK